MLHFFTPLFGEQKKLSHKQVIVKALIEHPFYPYKISDFQKGKYFAGYKAAARMNELVHAGIAMREKFDEGKFALYRLFDIDKANAFMNGRH